VPPHDPGSTADKGALARILCRQAEDWLAHAAEQLPGPRDPLVLVGAGQLGRETALRLTARGRAPVAFLDETSDLEGRDLEGIPVLGLDEAVAQFASSARFAVTIWRAKHRYLDSRARLTAAGCRRVCSFLDLAWSEPAALLPHYGFDLPQATLDHRVDIVRAFGLLAGDADRRHFLAHLRFRLGRDYAALPGPSSPPYLDPQLIGSLERITYVDGGAYDGDTLLALLAGYEAQLDAALLFEPDRWNHERLLATVSRLDPRVRSRLRCLQAALGEHDGESCLSAVGTEASAIATAGDQPTPVRRLDSVLVGTPGHQTLIKLDIEGAEEAAIRGAERTIRTASPIVVACLYHRPTDLWRIPLLLHAYQPDYRLHIRTEGTDGAGLVCYALPSAEAQRRAGVSVRTA
jgi:FkbM family methyltransferase